MNKSEEKLGSQQLLILFVVGKKPGILRKKVRDFFVEHKRPHEGIDRRIRELESRGLINRNKTINGTTIRLSKSGEEVFNVFSWAFGDALAGKISC